MSDFSLNDEEFVAQFEACTLSPDLFHHDGHVRMAFLYVRRYEVTEALRRFREGLIAFAASLGKFNRYHETITWAFVLLIRERLSRGGPEDWPGFAAANPDLLDWNNSVLKKYYSDETLGSDLAKTTFVLPDKIVS